MKLNVLIVDDCLEFQGIVKDALSGFNLLLSMATTTASALEQIQAKRFDLILLDLTLPDGDGYKIISAVNELRNQKKAKVVIISGSISTEDKVRSFELGADDFIVKPFDTREFTARIVSKLRKINDDSDVILARSNLELDLSQQKAFLFVNSKAVDCQLTPNEFKLLWFLVKNEGKFFRGEDLLTNLWPKEVHVVKHNVYTHMCSLRKKMGKSSELIVSTPKAGYSFQVKEETSQPEI